MKRIVEKNSNQLVLASSLLCLIFSVIALPGAVAAQVAWQANAKLEAAILKEDWAQAATLLGSDKSLAPPARLIKAHAYLALNKNNESLCLFLGADSKDDLEKWEEWTRSFVSKHPQAAIAHYFRGDALARLEKWDAALAAFNQALGLRPNHPLVLNARGVVYAATQQWDESLVDFEDSAQSNPSFADAYANRGALNIQRKDGAEGALKAFNRALEISPDFALALNGKGGIRLALGEWDLAAATFKEAGRLSTGCSSLLSEIIAFNLGVLSYSKSEAVSKAITKIAKAEPGTLATRITREDAGKMKWVVDDQIASHKRSPFPDKIGGGIDASGKATVWVIGRTPIITKFEGEIGAKGNAQWDLRVGRENKISSLEALRKELDTRFPNSAPIKPGPIDGFLTKMKYGDVIGRDPAGVSTEGIGEAHIDRGNWQIATLYGLCYPEPKGNAPTNKEK